MLSGGGPPATLSTVSSPTDTPNPQPLNMLSDEQVAALLQPLDPGRIFWANDGTRRLKHQDVRRRLTQIFGFAGWAEEIISNECIDERKDEKTGLIALTYQAHVRLHIRDGRGGSLTFFDGMGIWDDTQRQLKPGFCESVTQARHNIANGASSVGFLRAVMSLGDQFGGSLHLKVPPAHGFIQGTLTHPFIEPPQPAVPAQSEAPSAESTSTSGDDDQGESKPDDAYAQGYTTDEESP